MDTNYGEGAGVTKREGVSAVLPLRKGEAGRGGEGFSHADGGWGGRKRFEVVLTRELEVLAILNGEAHNNAIR